MTNLLLEDESSVFGPHKLEDSDYFVTVTSRVADAKEILACQNQPACRRCSAPDGPSFSAVTVKTNLPYLLIAGSISHMVD